MRGARQCLDSLRLHAGIIPADAGSTRKWYYFIQSVEDHPRGCGEHRRRLRFSVIPAGSSPRMRGARKRRPAPGECKGIIPADAGSTPTTMARRDRCGDHPRGCGEHSGSKSTSAALLGSSPRMRGARRERLPRGRAPRIIPADAGSTC